MPQDMISLILEQYLFDDASTLHACALVSRSFLVSSQKCLFHTIHLDHQRHCQRLHQVLLSNPSLFTYVRDLFLVGYESGGDISGPRPPPVHWACTEGTLHAVLNMFPHLRLLSLTFSYPASDWNKLSVEFKMALGRVFTLPSLTVCKVQGICNVPAECFRALRHLKELSLVFASVTVAPEIISASTDAQKIQSLERFTLSVPPGDSTTIDAVRTSIDMSHLRKVFVSSWMLNRVWEATKDSTGSLDTLQWYYRR